ncbi:hypothetical protein FE784_36865 [Paenibacillus hemerocallicola]|uniref:Uncharacterized protein n=1 Tax=Paenibacillus hemerocallicola TaxID=1172614 RepID=A0A5C4SX15_9BACL|nr:hypothetical protein [Paenibacillus hemerocallicola]TNJ59746.1 hypothetical protein FE784_36865 [Paenibacillus hemerocallicola]
MNKKKKLKKLLIWTASVLLVFAIGAYFVFDYATNYVLRSIVASGSGYSSIGTPNISPPQTKEETESTKLPEDKGTNTSETSVSGIKQDEIPKDSTSGQPVPSNSSTTKEPAKNDSTGPSTSQPNPETTQPQSQQPGANISSEQAQKAQEDITLKDKSKVTSVLLSKLSASDIKLFMQMSESGVSVEEKQKAKKIILQKLTEEEYNELIAIASKLGLSSSGKSYQESLKE